MHCHAFDWPPQRSVDNIAWCRSKERAKVSPVFLLDDPVDKRDPIQMKDGISCICSGEYWPVTCRLEMSIIVTDMKHSDEGKKCNRLCQV